MNKRILIILIPISFFLLNPLIFLRNYESQNFQMEIVKAHSLQVVQSSSFGISSKVYTISPLTQDETNTIEKSLNDARYVLVSQIKTSHSDSLIYESTKAKWFYDRIRITLVKEENGENLMKTRTFMPIWEGFMWFIILLWTIRFLLRSFKPSLNQKSEK